MRGRSYTPSPHKGYGRRGRSHSPRGRSSGGRRDMPTSLLVRNLRLDCRPEDLRGPFGQFGALKDIYLPRDYYTGNLCGFGFVQYFEPGDATEAKYHMDGHVLMGRVVTVVFANENRKKPTEMRSRERVRGRFHDRRRSYSRSPQPPPPRHARSRPRSPEHNSPAKRRHSGSISPQEKKHVRERSYSPRPRRSRSPLMGRSRSPSPEDYSREANGDGSP